MKGLFDKAESPTTPPADAVYLRVAVERGIEQLGDDPGLTYFATSEVNPGDRVEVPLGRANTPAGGIVLAVGGAELAAGIEPTRLKPILRRTGAVLPGDLIELARWMAGYYVCPLGMVLQTMMPASVRREKGRGRKRAFVQLAPDPPPDDDLPRAARKRWRDVRGIDPADFPMTPAALAQRIGLRSTSPITRLVSLGLLETVQRTDDGADRADDLAMLLPEREGAADVTLTQEQRNAVEGIASTLGRFGVHLLRGVTGSGKTEVYLRVIEHALAAGRSALVLVPEIALTPQTAGRFVARFSDAGVAVLHSGLTAAQRTRQWDSVASGRARVVVGARSAVFAPLPNPAVIIVDEEHDGSYKQDQLPRYHARDAAIKRAHLSGATVILGSATPSLESWSNAVGDRPRYTLRRLSRRVVGGDMPRVEVVDMSQERRTLAHQRTDHGADPWSESIGPTLRDAIARTLRGDGQVILLLNRRGYASHVVCPSSTCGWVMQCRDCDAAMVYHKVHLVSPTGLVRCHHCQAEQLLPDTCPVCGRRLIQHGRGTQRVEDELERLFGQRFGIRRGDTMLRVDSDTMRSARDYHDTLSRFAAKRIRMLLGTQMIAKGLDFPDVHLVGVVDADTAIHLPDFRAAERTFQLITQVAGRAGRGDRPGRVIVQTLCAHTPVIRHAAAHDYETFAHEELEIRAAACLPPVWRMARVICRDRDADKAQRTAAKLADTLRQIAATLADTDQQPRIDGPMPCPIARIAAQYRFATEIVAPARGIIQRILATARSRGALRSDARTAVDVDPVALL